MQKLLFPTLAICLILAACSKTQAPSGFNDPVFMVTYQDTTSKTITAGLNGVYLFTKYTLQNGVFQSTNTFADATCPTGDCPSSLSFEFRELIQIDSAFFAGVYDYTLPDSLTPLPGSFTATFAWGDIFNVFPEQTFLLFAQDSISLSSPIQNVSLTLPDNNPVEVFLGGQGSNGLYGTIYRKFKPGDPTAYPGVGIKASPVGNSTTLTAFQDFSASAVKTYEWNTGDTIAMITRDSTSVGVSYAVTVTDNQGKTASANLTELPYPLASDIRNAQVSFQSTPYNNPLQAGTVAIQWVDPTGSVWRSDRGKQNNQTSLFEVNSAVPYEANEQGDRVQKLKVRFNCILYNEDGLPQNFSGEGVIAMARP